MKIAEFCEHVTALYGSTVRGQLQFQHIETKSCGTILCFTVVVVSPNFIRQVTRFLRFPFVAVRGEGEIIPQAPRQQFARINLADS